MNKRIFTLLLAFFIVGSSFAYASKISDLATDSSVDGTEEIPVNDGGTTKKLTGQDIADLHELVDDTTPQLGGDLDANTNNILFDDETGILDQNGNEMVLFNTISSAVNQTRIHNAATGGSPQIEVTGDDASINLDLQAKGGGDYVFRGMAAGQAQFRIYEDTDNGFNYIKFDVPSAIGSNTTWLFPENTDDQVIGRNTTDTLTNKTIPTLKTGAATQLTVATAAVTATQSYHTIEGEGAASDTLSTISGTTAGQVVCIQAADTDHTISLDEAGNLILNGTSFDLDSTDDLWCGMSDATSLRELSRSDNGA